MNQKEKAKLSYLEAIDIYRGFAFQKALHGKALGTSGLFEIK
ncbi:hypothetical protein [Brevibacillus choshinensis]|nr:hypothetical protein [Brevibacillus choshinensis]